jgi:hypothetical protein
MANRNPRETETREKTTKYVYTPASTLPDPTPEPGWNYRWIATHVAGVADHSNVSKKTREGWEPVKAVDHPEMMLPAGANGNVEIGGLMLCKMPTEMVQARSDYFNIQAERQMESVDNNLMRQSDARMPIFNERSTEVRFGKGSK